MPKAKGLGKGLGALMGDAALQTPEAGSIFLPISQVEPGLNQPRKRFDDEALMDLADSIREHGIIQPPHRPSAVLRLLPDHRRRAPLAGRQVGGTDGSTRRHHRGG